MKKRLLFPLMSLTLALVGALFCLSACGNVTSPLPSDSSTSDSVSSETPDTPEDMEGRMVDMDYTNIIIAIVSILTLIGSAGGFIYDHKKQRDHQKEEKRGFVTVSIWSDYLDDIPDRIKNRKCIFFMNENQSDELKNNYYLYFCFLSHKENCYNTNVSLYTYPTDADKEKGNGDPIVKVLGTLSSSTLKVCLLPITENRKVFKIRVEYETEYGEKVLYTVHGALKDTKGIIEKRTDHVYLDKHKRQFEWKEAEDQDKKFKKIREFNYLLSESYTPSEIAKMLGYESFEAMHIEKMERSRVHGNDHI